MKFRNEAYSSCYVCATIRRASFSSTCRHSFNGRRVGRSHQDFLSAQGRRHTALAAISAAPLAGSRAFGTLSADSCQFLSDSKSLCWPPPLPPTLPKVAGLFALGRPMSPSLSILSRLFADRKLIKNQTPQKPSQNLKSRTPDRPNLGFGLAFGSILAWLFHEILDFVIICENHRNILYKAFQWVQHIQNLMFSHQN